MAPGPIENTVLKCLSDNYGISGSLERLSCENLNFLLTTSEGERFVVKIVDDDMPAEVSEMEFEASEYALSAGFSLKLLRIVKNINANNETGIIMRINS
jgi:Ser/Thr protein kinase RdoA (MazF antagonist)